MFAVGRMRGSAWVFALKVCRFRPVQFEHGPGHVTHLVDGQIVLVCFAGVAPAGGN